MDLETFCFELAREIKTDNFERISLKSKVDGMQVGYKCRFDDRVYLVDIKPASPFEAKFLLKEVEEKNERANSTN